MLFGMIADVSVVGVVVFYLVMGCVLFLGVLFDVDGDVVPRSWPDGDVYGVVDAYVHMFLNFGFGGVGMYYGLLFYWFCAIVTGKQIGRAHV